MRLKTPHNTQTTNENPTEPASFKTPYKGFLKNNSAEFKSNYLITKSITFGEIKIPIALKIIK